MEYSYVKPASHILSSKLSSTFDTTDRDESSTPIMNDCLARQTASAAYAISLKRPTDDISSPDDTSPNQISRPRGMDVYYSLTSQLNNAENEIARIESFAHDKNLQFDRMRAVKRHSIDVDMKGRHKAEIEATMAQLKRRHKTEELTLKGEYAALKAQHQAHKNESKKQRELVLAKKKILHSEVQRQINLLPREEVLACIDGYGYEERVGKRRKTQHDTLDDDKSETL
ncbi:hypothetical protein N0V94_001418 [Neodidymelliopsis sp. IMI 364377]|nr:hypothetical protein N0V94_001418 [Neodidymelliopsis sp. IMI 364377]